MALPEDTARAACAMRAAGVPQRRIAGMLGISESQVSRIRSAALERMRREGVLS